MKNKSNSKYALACSTLNYLEKFEMESEHTPAIFSVQLQFNIATEEMVLSVCTCSLLVLLDALPR